MTDPDFAAVTALIALVTDAPACKARLAELQKQIAAAAKAQAKLDADREVHAATVAALEAREIAVTERERVVTAWEAEACERGQRERFPFDPNGGRGTRSYSGLARA